jgi:pyruvate/2-oxoglutarate dehydrogenase complex dihydrolipoamide acyltransferase (E2) component
MPVVASPVARRAALRLGVDLAALIGSGPRGRIVKADVAQAALAPPTPAPAPPPVIGPSPASVMVEVDLDAALELCAQLDGVEPIDLVIRAAALAGGQAGAASSLGAIARERAQSPPDARTPLGIVELGPHGVDAAAPRLGPGQTATLCVGAIGQRPYARDGALVLAMVATLTLVHGEDLTTEDAVRFLAELRGHLQAPLALAFA